MKWQYVFCIISTLSILFFLINSALCHRFLNVHKDETVESVSQKILGYTNRNITAIIVCGVSLIIFFILK